MLAECLDHGTDVVKDLRRRDMFIHKDSHLIAAAESARDAKCKGSIRVCHKSHIAEGAVYGIIRTVAEGYF